MKVEDVILAEIVAYNRDQMDNVSQRRRMEPLHKRIAKALRDASLLREDDDDCHCLGDCCHDHRNHE